MGFIQKMLAYDPKNRPTIAEIKDDPWVWGEVPDKDELMNALN